MQKERKNCKIELLIKREAKLKNLGNSQPIHMGKNEKACLGQGCSPILI
jgi:hypothetical protein